MTTLDSIVKRQERLAARLGASTDVFRRLVEEQAQVLRARRSPKRGKGIKTIGVNIPDEFRVGLEREQARLGIKTYRDVIYLAMTVGYKVMLACSPGETESASRAPEFPPPRVVWPPENLEENRVTRIQHAIKKSEEKL